MPRRHGSWNGPGEWSYEGDWPRPGTEAWQGFGRRMLLRAVLFLAFVLAVLIGVVVLIVTVVNEVGGLTAALIILATPFALLMLAGIVGRSFFRSWRPVRRLIEAAGALADGDYSVRVDPSGSAAIRSVVASFNDMAQRLETADEQRRRLLADLGHELRTPLTVVRGEIEAMLDGVHEIDEEHLRLLMNEVTVMERLLEDLRTLSLIDAGRLELHREPTDLTALVEDVADGYRRRASEAAVSVAVRSTGDLPELVVDPVRIREVLTNLVVNALRAMPDGGELVFRVGHGPTGAVVEVTDTGTGIGQDELEHVFDRFHKGSTSRGSGLGLTISRDLVVAHGGSMALRSEPGEGTTVRIELPTHTRAAGA
ncbi:MAG: HAMP domain-containing histidine kinase [Acidimicrobiia bacterium]|nr:HAMP domain-containing histidine kinase [Acidimicrobiia bacterium]NNL12195.1 HAMP domain-containing histidine kinase [Acidimicrobiia bacterium]RZV43833.1 MAG: HAMP domain-containing histidine kinase [Acidimicrobiia bacterium]